MPFDTVEYIVANEKIQGFQTVLLRPGVVS